LTKPISKGARQIVDLVRAELATAQAERAVAGGKTIESRGCGTRGGELGRHDAHFIRMYRTPSSTDSTDRILGRS